MAKCLVGFMGSGKSSLARLLDEQFIDMDVCLENILEMSITDYFALHGEASFRAAETALLEQLLQGDHVIATGGGVVNSPVNRSLLKQSELVIYLKADFDTLYARLLQDVSQKRPIFLQSSKEELASLFQQRQPYYESVATVTIEVSRLSLDELAQEIKGLGVLSGKETKK